MSLKNFLSVKETAVHLNLLLSLEPEPLEDVGTRMRQLCHVLAAKANDIGGNNTYAAFDALMPNIPGLLETTKLDENKFGGIRRRLFLDNEASGSNGAIRFHSVESTYGDSCFTNNQITEAVLDHVAAPEQCAMIRLGDARTASMSHHSEDNDTDGPHFIQQFSSDVDEDFIREVEAAENHIYAFDESPRFLGMAHQEGPDTAAAINRPSLAPGEEDIGTSVLAYMESARKKRDAADAIVEGNDCNGKQYGRFDSPNVEDGVSSGGSGFADVGTAMGGGFTVSPAVGVGNKDARPSYSGFAAFTSPNQRARESFSGLNAAYPRGPAPSNDFTAATPDASQDSSIFEAAYLGLQTASPAMAAPTQFPVQTPYVCDAGYTEAVSLGEFALVGRAARAFNFGDFKEWYNEIVKRSKNCSAYLDAILLEHWTQAYCLAKRYNIMSSNIAEVLNGAIAKIVNELLLRHHKASAGLPVKAVSEWSFQVGSGVKQYYVDLAMKTCTCLQFQKLEIPFCHALAAARKKEVLVTELVGNHYTVTQFCGAYEMFIYHVPNESDEVIPPTVQETKFLPPKNENGPGRRRKRRIPPTGEYTVITELLALTCLVKAVANGHSPAAAISFVSREDTPENKPYSIK
ncbi:hypothetical protein AXX17_AT5G30950 [Arabidopsis thaliana]|uniref:SWIM-type domain-containing protein n=1 Tax=Arabidopsis thaliana TaxID=3702 RepID=A0A178USY1_ARATH|nr:hypothetical protein AXX17_AT5G30950 [Arabidopsis thaliana]